MLLPFLDAREVRICPVVTRQICLPKTAQKFRAMAKSAPISCETAQKSRGRDRGQGRSNRQRRCGRKPQHREKRTSVPCSPVSGAKNGLATPPPGAATRDPHPARHLARPAGKRSGSSSRKRTIRLHRLDSATLLSAYRSLTVISAARQRSMRPARMSHLAASPLADIANPPWPENVRDNHGPCRGTC